MSELASFLTAERLRDGRRVEIRALRPDDQADLVAAIRQTSPQSLYRRFFVPRRSFTPEEIAFFVHVDFVDHVALVAVMDEGGRRAVTMRPPSRFMFRPAAATDAIRRGRRRPGTRSPRR
jgi:hypothetical protein